MNNIFSRLQDKTPTPLSSAPSNHPAPITSIFSLRTILWAIIHCAFYFTQQLAELLAPLFLIVGIGWSFLPHTLQELGQKLASAEPQASHLAEPLSHIIPSEITISHYTLTPHGLIVDGLLLMLLAAIGATVSALAAREL
ncbi:hypothetical protein [Entomobacter blattae]|uniref:Uncharacterized protein n=1 Tax=Entomobacter blattae TaxID=2762277 RepID=A0A7H1NUY0_9PROT|nr:hypothetical protein [Entomobacter blattae]QNT79590.1 hypothetical protein JGUZn3_23900 [Entomobacter blattae]